MTKISLYFYSGFSYNNLSKEIEKAMGMKLRELKALIDRQVEYMSSYEDPEVVIGVKLPYSTVGGSPFVKVKTVQNGFDWDAGKFFFYPEEPLTPSDRDFAKQMTEMQKRAGNADYENRNLKAEIRRLQKKLSTS